MMMLSIYLVKGAAVIVATIVLVPLLLYISAKAVTMGILQAKKRFKTIEEYDDGEK